MTTFLKSKCLNKKLLLHYAFEQDCVIFNGISFQVNKTLQDTFYY